MYIITVRRITSGELLKYRKGFCIRRGYGAPIFGSSRFALTLPNCMLDDSRRKTMSLEGYRGHSETVATPDRPGQALNVPMPLMLEVAQQTA